MDVVKLGPVILPGMLPGIDGANINGPSVIKVPTFVTNKLGNYYLYFAHHAGTYIRMAYADNIEGPYTVYEPGTLKLSQLPLVHGHIASPDVHIMNDKIVMYFHGPSSSDGGLQKTFRAESTDGINFTPTGGALGIFYFRVWRYDPNNRRYALGKAQLYRSTGDAGTAFGDVGPIIYSIAGSDPNDFGGMGNIRHTAVRVVGSTLQVFFTRIGDAPESILMGTLDMTKPWIEWGFKNFELVLRPTEDWEGACLPVTLSAAGSSGAPENAVRDPAIYQENGSAWMFYTVKGEHGIAVARLFD